MTSITQTPAYRVAFSMYVALGGDKTKVFDSVDAIYAEIDKFYGKGSRITTESLTVSITENGSELYNDDAITGYKPVRIDVNVPQKYTDQQVEALKEESRQQGYDSGYDKGIADGYTQGESEGYSDGYAEGLEDGAEDQKALLEEITIIDNGVYEKEDGYKKVTVEVPIPEMPTFETESLTKTLKTNGTYNYTPTTDGFSDVHITVDVPTGGGDTGKPKIYNGFQFTGGDIAQVDFSQYDWSGVYDTGYFFENCSHSTGDWSNFLENYNGKILSGNSMFYNCKTLTSIPQLDTSKVTDMSYMFKKCSSLTTIPQLDTSNVTSMSHMFEGCSNLTSIPQFDTSNVFYMSRMFEDCSNLTSIPQLDCSMVTNFGIIGYYGSSSFNTTLKNLGGFLNLGKQNNLSISGGVAYGLEKCSALTYNSIMNVINNLYDRATAGYSILTFKLHANALALLNEEDIAIATNKGWTIA